MTNTVLASQNLHRDAVRENIRGGAGISSGYILMNLFASSIATYGLFANSPAVVISAMVVAMLLGPIAGISLAVVDTDMKFLLKSLTSLLVGVMVVMGTSFIIGIVHNDLPITNEIMMRTAPNLLDLMVALAGGAAGAYALVSPRVSISFVGVAIAVALVPPLSAASILFARGEIRLAFGALLLTFTNIVAIQFVSSVILWLAGFRRISRTSKLPFLTFVKGNGISIIILLALAVVFTVNLQQAIARQLYETTTRLSLQEKTNTFWESYLVETRFETIPGITIVRVTVRSPNPPTAELVAEVEAELPSPPDGTVVELRVRYIETTVFNRDGPLYEDNRFGTSE